MGKRNTIHKLPEYKGYSAYYYYDDEDKLWVGRIYHSADGEFTDMVAWALKVPTWIFAIAMIFGAVEVFGK